VACRERGYIELGGRQFTDTTDTVGCFVLWAFFCCRVDGTEESKEGDALTNTSDERHNGTLCYRITSRSYKVLPTVKPRIEAQSPIQVILFCSCRLFLVGHGNGSPSATNVVLVSVVDCCYQICDLLRLFHFTTDRRQTSHTQ